MVRRRSAASLLWAGAIAGLWPAVAMADAGELPAMTETRCAEQGDAIANAVVMRDAGAPRFEAYASAHRELEHGQVDQGVFISHLAEYMQALYATDSPFHGSPREVGRIWQKNCICGMGAAWAKRCSELQAPAP